MSDFPNYLDYLPYLKGLVFVFVPKNAMTVSEIASHLVTVTTG